MGHHWIFDLGNGVSPTLCQDKIRAHDNLFQYKTVKVWKKQPQQSSNQQNFC